MKLTGADEKAEIFNRELCPDAVVVGPEFAG